MSSALDTTAIRAQFPILEREVHGKPLVYLDHAASAQKPIAVIEAQREYLMHYHANVHRGVHALSQQATDAFERARSTVQYHIGAANLEEIIWVAGATDGINLVAQSWGREHIGEGDVILITYMEHHANIVPWQMLAKEKGARVEAVAILEDGTLDENDFQKKLKLGPKMVAFMHVSNTLGTINDAKRLTRMAKAVGAPVLIDGSQALPHMMVDVVDLDCDFYVFSGHKAYGPTGIGVLYGRKAILEAMNPWRGGGEMIDVVSLEKGTTYAGLPHKFEAGTPHISGAVALGVALQWLTGVGLKNVMEHETILSAQARHQLGKIDGMRFIGSAPLTSGAVSFIVEGVHPYDLGTLLDQQGIAVRTGHHCTQPIMDHFDIPGTVRASFGAYNTLQEVDALVQGVERALKMLR
ncbi:MAG: SufS family cysteine desulfurase [Flavobacteriales bacterium]|nr:SufS family cysteine desulfurase [Flavobacteriales bacterium]